MADILIKYMEMPKNCKECTRLGISHCPMKGEPVVVEGNDKPLNCPIIEVPSHGMLIDMDALNDRAYYFQRVNKSSFAEALSLALMDAPIILEASNGTNN